MGKPKKLAVQLEMKCDDCVGQLEKKILAKPFDCEDSLTFSRSRKLRRALRFRSNRVQDMNAADSLTLDQGAESSRDGFYFREFRHVEIRSPRIMKMVSK